MGSIDDKFELKTSPDFRFLEFFFFLDTSNGFHWAGSAQLGSTFESTTELNYLGRLKLVLCSAHVKFHV